VTIDDATGWIYSAFFVDQEGTMSSFLGLLETISAHGLFGSFYTDRGSHYFHTPVAGGAVDKKQLTQVGRALKQLGIRHIPSYTPEGRGRMERVFRTLQQRLPLLLRRASVLTKETANIWLRETYVPEHNARRLRRWPRGSARPSLTAAVRLALGCSGRDEKTAFQPNQKTGLAAEAMRTTHALQKADIFTRHRQLGRPTCNGTWKRQSVYRRGCHGRR
jgi:hypothetical protein